MALRCSGSLEIVLGHATPSTLFATPRNLRKTGPRSVGVLGEGERAAARDHVSQSGCC